MGFPLKNHIFPLSVVLERGSTRENGTLKVNLKLGEESCLLSFVVVGPACLRHGQENSCWRGEPSSATWTQAGSSTLRQACF